MITSDIYFINDVGLSDEVPYIDNGLEDNFKEGKFTLNGDQFTVDNIQIGSDNFPTVAVVPNQVTELVIDEDAAMMESLTAFKRAGADLVMSYFAPRVAALLRDQGG